MDTVQGTPEWFNARRGKLTASRFGAAVGICQFCTRNKCLREMTGADPPPAKAPEACIWGTKNEKNALKDYMTRTGNVVRTKGMYTHPDYDWIGGSPDGLVGDDGIIEIKCPFYKMKPHEQIPAHYYCQINGLMEILDRQWCDFVSWTPTSMKIYRVYRDPALFSFLLDRYATFFAHMRRGCSHMPRMAHGEKQQVLDMIAQSDKCTDYTYWLHLEPEILHGRWNSPPPLEYDDIDEPSSKVQKTDGAGDTLPAVSEESTGSNAT